LNKTFIKRFLFGLFIVICAIIVGFLVISYEAEGDKNMPYKLSKILMISTVDGRKNGDGENIWNISLSQVNDFYVYVEKADENTKEVISEIRFNNFEVTRPSNIGETKIYRPNGEKNALYLNATENMLYQIISFKGDMQDNLKDTVANIGGVTSFRYAIENLGNYVSNEAGEVVYNGLLLNKVGIALDQIKSTISFDMIIKTSGNVMYKGTIKMDTPSGDIVQEGQSNIEITDFKDVVFKRVSE
jgi:hypothetical protein